MAIIEKKVKINLENLAAIDVERIENAIRQAGLEPCRWAVVEMSETNLTILANGVENSTIA